MLSPNAETPAIRDFADNGRPEFEMLGGSLISEYAISAKFQDDLPLVALGEVAGVIVADLSAYRVALLGRRLHLPPDMCRFFASIAFDGGRG